MLNKEEQIEIIKEFERTLLESQEDLDPEFSKLIDEYFWDLI